MSIEQATAPRVRPLVHWTTLTRSVSLTPCETVPFVPGGGVQSSHLPNSYQGAEDRADRPDLDNDPIQQFVRPAVKPEPLPPSRRHYRPQVIAPYQVLTGWSSLSSICKVWVIRRCDGRNAGELELIHERKPNRLRSCVNEDLEYNQDRLSDPRNLVTYTSVVADGAGAVAPQAMLLRVLSRNNVPLV